MLSPKALSRVVILKPRPRAPFLRVIFNLLPIFLVLLACTAKKNNLHYLAIDSYTPLSGEDIWISLLTQKRFTVHIDGCDISPLSGGDIWIKAVLHQRYTPPVNGCDISNDLRLFLKF